MGQERCRKGQGEDLRSLGGWFHETLAQASGNPGLIALLTQLRHKTAWMYVVEPPAEPKEAWAEHAAIVDAVARGDAERARALTAAHAERATSAHRLRPAGRVDRVRNPQRAVNTAGLLN
ncbi:GntR family transcriptional regulator OS=Streptomyces alboniger OX=132473 GN=CP975_26955 PE=4 SV=1 [Streptomyces alboniger]